MNKTNVVGAKAEWHLPKDILVHTPGGEIFNGLLHPEAALFEKGFDSYAAQEEHIKYIEALKASGANVHILKDVLMHGTLDEKNKPKKGEELDELIGLASKALTYISDGVCSEEQEEYKQETLKILHPKDLVRVIFERPEVKITHSKENNVRFDASYKVNPLMNLYFLRDQQITTDTGIVMGNMNSSQRAFETQVTEFALKKLGITPSYKINGGGKLEGGDYIPAGEFALIGQGLRTNENAVMQIIENSLFGHDYIAVVKDPYQKQDEMHLDTYFNIVGPNKALILEDRLYDPKKKPLVDIYSKNCEGYNLTQKDLDFGYFLKGNGFDLVELTKQEQDNYGVNFLCVGEDILIGVEGVSPRYEKLLANNGIEAALLDFTNMTCGYGGPHCTTQVFNRIDPGIN